MSDANTHPRVVVGLQSARPTTPGEDGLIYVSEQGISVWDASASAWRFTANSGGSQAGVATLVTGEVSVTGVNITASSKIFVSLLTRAGTISAAPLYNQTAITVGVGTGSFHLASVSIAGVTNTSDTSVLNYQIVD